MPKKYNHKKNILNESAMSKSKVESGQIVRFSYSGKKVTTKRPLVLVLHPKWQGHLHGVNLDYLSASKLKKLWDMTKLELSGKIEKLIKLRLPLLKADIGNPKSFYKSRLKGFLKGEAYRTYAVGSIGGLKLIDYRFEGAFAEEARVEAEAKKNKK